MEDDENTEIASEGESLPVPAWTRFELFATVHWRGLVSALVPLVALAMLAPFPPEKYQWCAYTLVLMAVFWVTEVLPLAITSFLPILVFPLTGVMSTEATCACYINDTVLMFLGSLILAYSVEQSGLHNRLALTAVRKIGYSHYRLLFALSFITMFISMWITNTAATTMMVPINFALLKVFEDQNILQIYDRDSAGELIASDVTTCYFCTATFSATIGGIGTLVGTATNLVFKGLFQRMYPEEPEYLSFPLFSAFSIPYMLVMQFCVYLNMLVMYFGFLREGESLPVPAWTRFELFATVHWRGLVSALVPLVALAMLAPFPPEKYQWCAYTLVLMAVFWVTEVLPLAITSFLPILVFPLTGVMSTEATCACYINDTVLMFLGSLILAYSVEQSGLHNRLALTAVRKIGYSHYRLLFALSFITMFISMWITNTAATTMMVPINFALLKVFEDQNILQIYDRDSAGELIASDVTTCYFCTATFSATIGGIGTLVGTATNLVFKGLFQRMYPEEPEYLSFPLFSAFSIPYMLVMQFCVYLNMLVMYFGFLRPKSKAAQASKMSAENMEATKKTVEEQYKQLGRITFWEIMVIILFGIAILLFFSRAPQIFSGWGDAISDYYQLDHQKFVADSSAVMLIIFFMMLLPSTLDFFKHFYAKDEEVPDKPITSVLNWNIVNKTMPWSFMFLLGGGFALSEAAKKENSDLNGKIGEILSTLEVLPNPVVILMVIIFTVFVTNFASNVAVCNVIAPIAMQLAVQLNQHPLWYNIAAGFSASYAMCVPVGTPGNLVVQGAANIPTIKMMKAGAIPSVIMIFITWISVCFWAPVVWPVLLSPITNDTST